MRRRKGSQRRRARRWRCTGALIVLSGVFGCAEAAPPEREAAGPPEGASPRTYTVRLDSERGDPGAFDLAEDDDGIRIQTGPAGIAYRQDETVRSGDFRVEATFVQYGAPVGYREAYGIFVGGRDLDAPDLEYTYLLIRPTGDFLVKRRIGETTETLADWTPHPAVQTVAREGDEPRNTLAVEVEGPEARFLVNGTLVHVLPAARVRPHGIAGVRANHRLDVRIDDWFLGAIETES